MRDRMQGGNVVLIGMPGCGKSTIGVVLAKIIGYQFIDSDLLIQEKAGKLLKDILAEEGTEAFLELENAVNAGIATSRAVIATGGSAVYGREAMEHLREIGTVVYIHAGYRTIQKRLSDLHQRGVAFGHAGSLFALYQERVPLYEKYAHIKIHSRPDDIAGTALAVRDLCFRSI